MPDTDQVAYNLDPIKTTVVVCLADGTWQAQTIIVTPKRPWTRAMLKHWAEERAGTLNDGPDGGPEYTFLAGIHKTIHDRAELEALTEQEGPPRVEEPDPWQE